MMYLSRFVFILGLSVTLAACGRGDEDAAVQSVPVDGNAMVAIANPHAAEAAMGVLREGGTAIDAAIAAQAVLSLVEPQSSGLGGGAFLLWYDGETGEIRSFDGREMAPRSVRPDHFLNEEGAPRHFVEIVAGGMSVGVPGVVAMMAMVHEEEGALPWGALFDDAIRLSEGGFAISPRLRTLTTYAPWTAHMPDTVAYFRDEAGEPHPAGHVLTNPDYAATLQVLSAEGPDAFYEGSIAEEIVAAVQGAPRNAAELTMADMASYRALERAPICRGYRAYTVCSMGPPTSGGLAILQTLGLLEQYDLAAMGPGSVEAVHVISEASRLAFADRDMFVADSDYIAVPVEGMLSGEYLATRAELIDQAASMGRAEAGNPWSDEYRPRSPDETQDIPGTSHLSIIDAYGNAVSMTTSVESLFGSHIMAGGMFLNNQLTDFSHVPSRDGVPVANAPQPGKRPRSSMSPVIVLGPDGEPFALTGSAGGSRIIGYTLQHIIAMVDWEMSAEEAMALPRHINRNGATDLEEGTPLEELAPALEAMGHQVNIRRLNSGSHTIRIVDGQMDGGADPRREGVVLTQ